MGNHEDDRRVLRTRQAIREAFIGLILDKGYEAVTIQDILDRANVGRSTFYSHYQDKEALLFSHFEAMHSAFDAHIQAVLGASSNSAQADNVPLVMLRYIEKEHHLFKALLGNKGSGRHLSYVRDYFLKGIRSILKPVSKASLPPYQWEAVAQYLANSFLTLVVWWLDNDLPCPSEEVYKLMMRLIEPGLKDVLEVSTLWNTAE